MFPVRYVGYKYNQNSSDNYNLLLDVLSITFYMKSYNHGHPSVDGTMMEEGILASVK